MRQEYEQEQEAEIGVEGSRRWYQEQDLLVRMQADTGHWSIGLEYSLAGEVPHL